MTQWQWSYDGRLERWRAGKPDLVVETVSDAMDAALDQDMPGEALSDIAPNARVLRTPVADIYFFTREPGALWNNIVGFLILARIDP